MKMKWMGIVLLVVFIIVIAISVTVINDKNIEEVDIVAINEAVKIIESNWGHVENGDYSSIALPFTILDHSGAVLYQTDSRFPATIYEAIRNRDIIIDVERNNDAVGKLLIHNEDKDLVQKLKQQLVWILIITFSVLLILCFGYIFYINYAIIKPFRQLQSFAVHVARGNLDIPLKISKNNPFGAFTESFDIMREELAAARQSEYDANRSKKELVASLSHDIQTPLASIKAVSELMLLQVADEKVIKQINAIHAKAEQINLLVTDMFHATLEELQQLKVTVTEEPSHVLTTMIENMDDYNQINANSIPECIILIDVIRMQQVLNNIVSNAYKYAGTPITITSQINHPYLELHIHDDGKGIDEAELPFIYNKYYRGNNAESHSGSGLGLHISQYFMHQMQGEIDCYNRDAGFTVSLKMKLA